MMLSKELNQLVDMASKLQMLLSGLRVPEELVGVMDYACNEAEKVFDRLAGLEYAVDHGVIHDADMGLAHGATPGENGSPDSSGELPTMTVTYEDYPNVRVIFYKGRRLINACAPVDGLTLALDRREA